jgi:hypothetical protein
MRPTPPKGGGGGGHEGKECAFNSKGSLREEEHLKKVTKAVSGPKKEKNVGSGSPATVFVVAARQSMEEVDSREN